MGETKEARLAAALRENLKRRKAQARERQTQGQAAGEDARPAEPDHTDEKAAPGAEG